MILYLAQIGMLTPVSLNLAGVVCYPPFERTVVDLYRGIM